jgi:hypothetical protein
MDWAAYAAASRDLAALRDARARDRAESERRASTTRAATEPVRAHLVAQRDHLTSLAGTLKQAPPALGEVEPAPFTDPDQALRSARECLARADGYARAARQRAEEPALLPGVPARIRNALVYAAATLLASVGAWLLFQFGTPQGRIPLSLVPWSMCGLPSIAFSAGYLALVFLGRPTVDTGRTATRSPRTGFLICYVGMAVTTFLLLVTTR